ncbi:MAG: hypothetical protein QNJ53_00020 [Pleurocapsa sp. MO_192.B19]|nr:hypothetical protein [Pleurocapsa sp. MO_192.B19]
MVLLTGDRAPRGGRANRACGASPVKRDNIRRTQLTPIRVQARRVIALLYMFSITRIRLAQQISFAEICFLALELVPA